MDHYQSLVFSHFRKNLLDWGKNLRRYIWKKQMKLMKLSSWLTDRSGFQLIISFPSIHHSKIQKVISSSSPLSYTSVIFSYTTNFHILSLCLNICKFLPTQLGGIRRAHIGEVAEHVCHSLVSWNIKMKLRTWCHSKCLIVIWQSNFEKSICDKAELRNWESQLKWEREIGY